MIMNPKLAHELREGYRSAAMRAGLGGLLGGFSLAEAVWFFRWSISRFQQVYFSTAYSGQRCLLFRYGGPPPP